LFKQSQRQLHIRQIAAKQGKLTQIRRNLKYDTSAFRLPRQYTGNDLMKCLERLILLDFSAVRQRGKVEFRPGLDHLKCVKNETKIIKWEALYMILFM